MKHKILYRFLVTTALLALCLSSVLAGPSGKIAGVVKDKKSGEPVIGANVFLEGTTLGAATDVEGQYNILNIPPGTYTLSVSMIGYIPSKVQNVRVSIDLTTRIDIELTETVLQLGQEVVVVAERPLVQMDLTSSTAVVNDRDMQALPVTEFQDVLQLQAGVVAGHFRGGRSGEVAYWVDGVPVTDAFNGGTVVDVNKNSIQEMQLVTGAFNAEYGKAMSGIVNIVTKSGSNTTNGSLTVYGGGYATSHTDIFTGLEKLDPLGIRNVEGTLSGPLFQDKLFYYANARYYYASGSLFGIRKFNPGDITNSTDPNPFNWNIQQTGDGKRVPMADYLKGYAQAKVTWKALPTLDVSYNFIVDNSRGKDYDFGFKYNPDGILSNFKKGYLNTLTVTHMLSSNTFYTFGLSYFFRDERRYLDQNPMSFEDLLARKDPYDQRYVHTKLLSAPEGTFLSGGTNMFHGLRNTSTYVAKFDITSQVTNEHQVKAGLEYNYYRLYLHNINLRMSDVDNNRDPVVDGNPFLTGPVVIPSMETQNNQEYTRKPQQIALYVQDKMEFKSLIVNIGVRLDYFRPDGDILADPTDPNIFSPLRPENQDSVVAPGGTHSDAVAARLKYWYKSAKEKWQISPRLGIAFPITERGIVHFSYGLFLQIPTFERLYDNPGYKLRLGGSTNLGIIGNPDLEPEQTTSGELGVQQQLTDDIAMDITGYFRDIRNLTGTLNEVERVFGGTAVYSKYVNADFGFVRGIILSIDKRFAGGLSANLDYTFQIAKGNASDPAASFNLRNSGVLPETQLIPLDWDQRHTLKMTLNYQHQDDWGGGLIFQYGTGTPYTPRQIANVGQFSYNSEIKPSTYNLDARVYKNFRLGSTTLSLFLRVNNVFDTKNAYGVFTDSGLPDYSIDGKRLEEINPPQRIATVKDWYTRPFFYGEPRRVEFGTSLFF